MAKFLTTTIQVNLCCLLNVSLGFSPELSLLKILPLAYHHSHFWPSPWISHIFHNGLFEAAPFFYSSGSDFTSFLQLHAV